MKKLFVLAAAVLALTAVSCSKDNVSKDDVSKLYGSWKAEKAVLYDVDSGESYPYTEDFGITTITFEAGGKGSMRGYENSDFTYSFSNSTIVMSAEFGGESYKVTYTVVELSSSTLVLRQYENDNPEEDYVDMYFKKI